MGAISSRNGCMTHQACHLRACLQIRSQSTVSNYCATMKAALKSGQSCILSWSPARISAAKAEKRQIVCKSGVSEPRSRRAAAILFGGLSLLAANPVLALLPAEDEEDEQLVGKAKSKRKERLAEERKVEKSFVKQADYNGVDISSVQNAVNRLAKEGLSIESGDLKGIASSESWVGELKKAVGDLSSSPAAQSSSKQVISSLDTLSQSFRGGNLDDTKSSFASAVSALQGWISDAGLSSQIKGL